MERYEVDENGNAIMHHSSGKWFAYAFGKYRTECLRGKGNSKEEAVQDSIYNTEKS